MPECPDCHSKVGSLPKHRPICLVRNNKALRDALVACGGWEALAGDEAFQLIVSNPPYIRADDEHLAQGDLRFEPPGALTDFADGLSCIRQIIAGCAQHLLPQGWLLFEHGYDQAQDCRQLLLQAGFQQVASVADLAGIERVTLGQKPAE